MIIDTFTAAPRGLVASLLTWIVALIWRYNICEAKDDSTYLF